MLGDYIFFAYGLLDINGNEPYLFNSITKEYRLIKDLSLGKTAQNNDANSSIINVIYDNDYLYFTASSDATPVKLD